MNGSPPPVPPDDPIPAELLADLQAGLLDDATAARVRRRVRSDPDAGPAARNTLAALDRVRRDLAELGQDAASAPPVPAEVSARLNELLRAQPAPPGRVAGWKRAAAVAGAGAAALAAVLGGIALIRTPASAPSTRTSLGQITVSPAAPFGLSAAELQQVLTAPPTLGPLSDPRRRTACLTALGYRPETPILGARPLEVGGRPGILVMLPPVDPVGPDTVTAVVVAPDCDATHHTALAQTVVGRPGGHR